MAPEDKTSTAVALAEIAGKFDIMMANIEAVKEKQEAIHEHVQQIRNAVYHPYKGLFACDLDCDHCHCRTYNIRSICEYYFLTRGIALCYNKKEVSNES